MSMLSDLQETPPMNFKAPQVSVVFMGTPEFAQTVLAALVAQSYHLVGVVTQPDRAVGREQIPTLSPVKVFAEAHDLPLFQPEKIDADAIETIRHWKPDVIIVAAYGRILPQSLLSLPGFGCLNIHASLLPRWRGASPVANALMAGDTITGITLMHMDAGVDTGHIIATRELNISPDERAPELLSRLAELGATLLTDTLPLWITRSISPVPQPEDGATQCQLIEREDGRIFWNMSAVEIYNRYRGLYPWPGVFTYWKRGGDGPLRIKIHSLSPQLSPIAIAHPVGTVIEIGEKVGVVTGSGVIFLNQLQVEGKKPTPISEFLQGYPDFMSAILT